VYSPHPVETTVLFFRSGAGGSPRTYAHLADIPSFEVLGRLSAAGGGRAAMSEASRQAFLREIRQPVDLKKVDAGGGLIHGDAADFVSDESAKILLSHGVPESRGRSGRTSTASFGEADVLVPGGSETYFRETARACLAAWFPRSTPSEIDLLVRSPVVEISPGDLVHPAAGKEADVRLILGGIAEETDPAARAVRRLGMGSLAGGYSAGSEPTVPASCRARGAVTVLSIPAAVYRQFVQKNGSVGRVASLVHDALALCPAFAGIKSEGVLNHIAASAEERRLAAGTTAAEGSSPAILVLAHGEVDLSLGSQLIETLHPGGFWGEERIVSTAPGLASARAATDCVLVAVPAHVLADVPSVQWELLETFERRLRSLRAGFRFEWSESFRVNVRLLDDQHQELFSRVNLLSQVLGTSGDLEGHETEKRSVLEYARLHFRDEEALMEANAYPRHGAQKRAHEMLMRQLERLTSLEERRARPRSETAVDYLKDWLISHTLLEDLQYRDFFAARGIT
jgi:hemerythrin